MNIASDLMIHMPTFRTSTLTSQLPKSGLSHREGYDTTPHLSKSRQGMGETCENIVLPISVPQILGYDLCWHVLYIMGKVTLKEVDLFYCEFRSLFCKIADILQNIFLY